MDTGQPAGDPADPAPPRPPAAATGPAATEAGGAADDVEPLRLLLLAGVDDAVRLSKDYSRSRILAVCAAADRQKGRLKNVGGWIKSALRRGWTV